MKKVYETPEIEFITPTEDILQTSGTLLKFDKFFDPASQNGDNWFDN